VETATYTFHPKPPYNFFYMLQRLMYARHELYRFESDHSVIRTLNIRQSEISQQGGSGGPSSDKPWKRVLTCTTWNKNVWEPVLRVDVVLEEGTEPLTAAEDRWLRKLLAHIWMVDVDLMPFYRQMSEERPIAPLLQLLEGYRPPLDGSLFECMVKTIIGQQLNLAFARKLNERLCQLAAPPLVWRDVAYPVFPEPEELAALNAEQLMAMKFSQRKAEYVLDFSRGVSRKEIPWPTLEEALKKPDEEFFQEWLTIRGVGVWTVECVLIFGLGRPDLLPAADVGLRNAVKKVYRLYDKPTEEEMRKIGRAWKPWSSFVTAYLWESLVHYPNIHRTNSVDTFRIV